MEIILKLQLSGVDFSPRGFNESLPADLIGSVIKYNQYKNKKIKENEYWFVEKPILHNDVTNALYEFIKLYTPYLSKLSQNNCSKYAEIIIYYHNVNEIRGFFIGSQLIKICNSLGLEIDIDIYTHFDD